MIQPENLYAKTAFHRWNNEHFVKLVRRYEWATWMQPNPDKAPWHWRAVVRGSGPYPARIEVWPHVAKAMREGGKVVRGWDNICALFTEVIEEDGYGPDLIEEDNA